ncbi:hypothetical protein RB595_008626 [Gaeumannomyces hyphopodioides]
MTESQAHAAFWPLSFPREAVESMLVPRHSNYSAEHNDGFQTESVIEPDGRMPVYSQDYQDGGRYRSVVKIQARFGSHWMMATGWLIKPNLLVTAGHVVFDWTQDLGQVQEVRCYIGYHGRGSVPTTSDSSSGTPPAVQCRWGAKVVTTLQWVTNNNDRTRAKDFALIELAKPFIGKLNLFKFTNTTPVIGTGVILGVVGYPGDKSVGTESGAEMYEQFLATDYNLETNKNHMIEYKISTFGGQSGAPIISRQEGVVIGTHCYGASRGSGNSGNAIGGKYGNDYNAFIDVFSRHIATSGGEFVPVPLQTATGDGGRGDSGSHEGAESWISVIGGLVGAASPALPFAGTLIGGPVGGALGTVVGGLIGSLASAESMEDDSLSKKASDAAPDRAVLAEAALQTVMALQGGPQTDYILNHIKRTCGNGVPNVDKIADALRFIVTKHASQMTVQAMNRNSILTQPPAEAMPDRRRLEALTESGLGDFKGKDLYECLMTPTIPVSGEEGFIGSLGPLISKGMGLAKPIVTDFARKALEKYGPKFISIIAGKLGHAESTFDDHEMLNKNAVAMVIQRAYLADASLQALSSLNKSDLQMLKLEPQVAEEHGLDEEGVWDFFKSVAQTIGPIALQAGKDLVPIVFDHVKNKIAGGRGESGVDVPQVRTGQHLSVRDRLVGRKRSMPRLNDVFNNVSDPGSSTEQTTECGSADGRHAYRRRRSIDCNPDAPIRSYTPPPMETE